MADTVRGGGHTQTMLGRVAMVVSLLLSTAPSIVGAQFTRTCGPTQLVTNADVTVSYELGTVSSKDAVQFTVKYAGTGYGAIGLRDKSVTATMVDYDVYGFDGSTNNIMDAKASGTSAPAADGQNDATFVSRTGDTVVFYRLLNTADTNDFAITLGTSFKLGWAVGPGTPFPATAWQVHTSKGNAEVTINACPAPATFTKTCGPTQLVTNADVTVSYELGTVSSKDAVQFTVKYAGTGYGAIGLRDKSVTASMVDYDVYGFDGSTNNVMDAKASGTSAPAADGQNDATFVSRTGDTVVFYRLLNTGDANDFAITLGTSFKLGWAVGPGTPFPATAWQVHTSKGNAEVTINACPAPATFTRTCGPTQLVTNADVTVSYELGTVSSKDAVQFTVKYAGTGYGAIGLRDKSVTATMVDYDVYGFDGSTNNIMDAKASGTSAPAADGENDATFVSRTGDTVVFYRLLNTADTNDFAITLGTSFKLGWAVGPGTPFPATAWQVHTSKGNAEVTINACPAPATFTKTCGPTQLVTNADVTVSYELGTVSSKDAVQFTVKYAGTGYGAIGLRDKSVTASMVDYDVYGFDGSTNNIMDAKASGTSAPVADGQNDATFVSRTGDTVVFYRLLNTADTNDFAITLGTSFKLGWAVGPGTPFPATAWQVHTSKGNAEVTIQTSCQVPATFTKTCGPTQLVTNADVTVSYELGTVSSKDAVQFTVKYAGTGYGAIGLRDKSVTASMVDYDVYGFDGSTNNIMDAKASGTSAPAADGQNDATFVSRTGDTVVFYRLLSTGDANDFAITLGTSFKLGWAVGPGTPFPATAWQVHTSKGNAEVTIQTSCQVPAAFTKTCGPTQLVTNADVTVSYELGTVSSKDAVQFTVKYAGTGYGAIGLRAKSVTASMVDYDVYGFDGSTNNIMDAKASGTSAPAADGQNDATFVSRTGDTVVFYRLLNTADTNDFAITVGASFKLGWAVGPGTPFPATAWQVHTSKGNAEVTINACPAPATFTKTCGPTQLVTNADVTVSYELGTVSSKDAVQFTVKYAGTGYGAIGLRDKSVTASMVDYDVYGFDGSTNNIMDAKASGTSAPAADGQNDATFVSRTGDTVVFYRLLNTADTNDFAITLGTSFKLGWAVGPGTPFPATAWQVHTSKGNAEVTIQTSCQVPAAFTKTCGPTQLVTNADVTVSYELGTVSSKDAVQFTVKYAGTGYGAIGLRDKSVTASMVDYDVYGFDGSTNNIMDAKASGTSAPAADGQNDATFVSRTGDTVVFYRLLNTADTNDFAITLGTSFKLGWAVGPGTPFPATAWQVHTSKGNAEVTISACPAPGTFIKTCGPTQLVTNADVTVSYDLGTVSSKDAVQFTVKYAGTGYGTIGLRDKSVTATMVDYDVYGFDGSTNNIMDAKASGTSAPAADGQNDATFVSRTGGTVVFYRLLNTADTNDFAITLGTSFKLGWAVGPGTPFPATAWQVHTAKGNGEVTIRASCQAGPSTPAPPTPSPPSAIVASPGRLSFPAVAEISSIMWSANATALNVTLQCSLTSWCAIGFGKTIMALSDTIFCHADGCIDGRLSNSRAAPTADAQQDITTTITKDATTFTAVVTRLLNTGDALGDFTIPPPPAKVESIWATGPHSGTPQSHPAGSYGAISLDVAGAAPALGNVQTHKFSDAFTLQWEIKGDIIEFKYFCSSGTWCSLGLGKTMSDADTLTCMPAQTACVDGHVSSESAPTPDATNDILAFEMLAGGTTYTFSRKLVTRDPKDRSIIDADMDVILATGGYSGSMSSHSSSTRGQASINFFSGASRATSEPEVKWWLVILAICLILLPGLFMPLSSVACAVAVQAPAPLGRMINKGYGIVAVGLMWAGAFVCVFFATEEGHEWYHALGHVAQVVLGLLLTIPSGNQSWIWLAFKMPHERAVMFHAMLGTTFFMLSLLHGIMYLVDAEVPISSWEDYGEVVPLSGFLCLVFMGVMWLSGMPPIRRAVYHIFLIIHWATAPLILLFAVLHVPSTAFFLIPGVLSLAAQRIVQEVILPWYTILSKKDAPSRGYTKLHIGASGTLSRVAPPIFPGMYLRLRFPGDMFQSHPFSVVRCHSDTQGYTLVIKNMGLGSSTSKLIQTLNDGSMVRVSEPIGRASIDVRNYDRVLLVGGGVGVTPLIGALYYLRDRTMSFEMGANQSVEKRVFMVWSVRDVELLELLTEELLQCVRSLADLELMIHYTGGDSELQSLEPLRKWIHKGRPNIPDVLAKITPGCNTLGVFTCGPVPLTKGAADAVASDKSGAVIDVHNETFEM